MGAIGNTNLTLLDHAKRLGPDNKIQKIVEVLAATNHIMEDMIVIESNTELSHKFTIRTGLPSIAWRQINKGVQPTKSTTKQVNVSAGMLEGRGQVDEEIVALAADGGAFRLSENAPNIEAISQSLASTLFYGDAEINSERFTGLSKYFSATSGVDAAANVINAGGTTAACTSLWLVFWGENTIHGFFPKGSSAGITHEDKGKEPVSDGNGGTYYAWVDQYKAKMGLAVKDWRYAVRICNINTSASLGAVITGATLMQYMVQAINKVPLMGRAMAKPYFYCNSTLKTTLEIAAMDKSNAFLTTSEINNGNGEYSLMLRFLGIPVRRCDALVNTETVVS